ncbi:hypothetical protein HK098_004054 [Nowakowskiella sp. JEL0407]|nr:hypothetical protein HK098_004054 [Nowakowskiella sp. JEL0407]
MSSLFNMLPPEILREIFRYPQANMLIKKPADYKHHPVLKLALANKHMFQSVIKLSKYFKSRHVDSLYLLDCDVSGTIERLIFSKVTFLNLDLVNLNDAEDLIGIYPGEYEYIELPVCENLTSLFARLPKFNSPLTLYLPPSNIFDDRSDDSDETETVTSDEGDSSHRANATESDSESEIVGPTQNFLNDICGFRKLDCLHLARFSPWPSFSWSDLSDLLKALSLKSFLLSIHEDLDESPTESELDSLANALISRISSLL